MKILDVDLLQDGLKRNMAMLERLKNETENIERTVSGLVEMDELLKGAGGNAIRDFYAECHQPFLQFFQLFSVSYLQTLQQMESALLSLEPDPAGYIRQEFLEGELEQGLTLIGNLTEALTNEANSIMDSVSDIVALPHLDDSAVQEGVITSKKKRDDTVQKLNEFDYSQTVSLNPVEQDLRVLQDCLIEMEGLFQNGLSDIHFQTSQWSVNPARKRLVWDLATRESTLPILKKYSLTEELSSMLQTYLQGVSPISFGLGGQVSRPNVFMGPAVNKSNGNPLHLNFWKNNLIPSVEQLISATEAETLINEAVNVKKVTDEYGSFSEESVIEGTYYTLPDGKIIRQYYGRTGAQQYKYVQSIPKERIGSGKTLEDIFPPITKIEEFLIGDIIAMSEDPSPESVAEAALFTVFKPLKMVDKIIDSIKDGEKKIEKIEDKGMGDVTPKKKSVPDFLKERWEAGNNFNKENRPRYPYNEVELEAKEVGGKKYVVDSYAPTKEIVSRKFTQLSEVQEKTAKSYLNEITKKYSSGSKISNGTFNPNALKGGRLKGELILEIPVQNKPIPQTILDEATKNRIIIRDIKGKVYN